MSVAYSWYSGFAFCLNTPIVSLFEPMKLSTSFALCMHLVMFGIYVVTIAHNYTIVYWLVSLCQMLPVAEQIHRTLEALCCRAADVLLSLHGQRRQGVRDIPRDRAGERYKCGARHMLFAKIILYIHFKYAHAHFSEYNSSPCSDSISYLQPAK